MNTKELTSAGRGSRPDYIKANRTQVKKNAAAVPVSKNAPQKPVKDQTPQIGGKVGVAKSGAKQAANRDLAATQRVPAQRRQQDNYSTNKKSMASRRDMQVATPSPIRPKTATASRLDTSKSPQPRQSGAQIARG